MGPVTELEGLDGPEMGTLGLAYRTHECSGRAGGETRRLVVVSGPVPIPWASVPGT
jgi:hypothetical protein